MNKSFSYLDPQVERELDIDFLDAHEEQIYHSLGGCEIPGFFLVPKTVIRAIENWCGNCTDPYNGPDHFNNPRAMFTALNLIYKLLDELQRAPMVMDLTWMGELHEVRIPKISEFTTKGEEEK